MAAEATLQEFLDAPNPGLADHVLGRLVFEVADPVIRRTVNYRLSSLATHQDREDVCGDVTLDLVARPHWAGGQPPCCQMGDVGGGRNPPAPRPAPPADDTTERLDRQRFLARLWAEIKELPVGQRAAILLNLRDEEGASAIVWLP